MSKINDLILRLKHDWQVPRRATIRGELSPFTLVCYISEKRVSKKELESLNLPLPDELVDLWTNFSSATLFKDNEFSQWGLELLSPEDALIETDLFIKNREEDYLAKDLVLGHFLGDSDLLLVRCNPSSNDYGNVVVALPIDPRNEWYTVANSLTSFLDTYISSNGDKYWEL